MLGYAEHYIRSYDEITVKQSGFNKYCHHDGIRDVDPGFRAQVETILKDLYKQLKESGAINGRIYYA